MSSFIDKNFFYLFEKILVLLVPFHRQIKKKEYIYKISHTISEFKNILLLYLF